MKGRQIFIFLLILLFLPIFGVQADDQCPNGGYCTTSEVCVGAEMKAAGYACSGACVDVPGDYCCCKETEAGEEEGFSTGNLDNYLGKKTGLAAIGEFSGIVGNIGAAALSIVGVIVVSIIVYGGIILMTASGNEEKIKSGKKIVIGALIGMVIIVLSYGAAGLVYNTFSAGGGPAGGGGGEGGTDCPTASAPHFSSVACYENKADCEDSHLASCICTGYGTCSDDQTCCYFGWIGGEGDCTGSGGTCKPVNPGCNLHNETDLERQDCNAFQTCCKSTL